MSISTSELILAKEINSMTNGELFFVTSLGRFNNWFFRVGADAPAVSVWKVRSQVVNRFTIPLFASIGAFAGALIANGLSRPEFIPRCENMAIGGILGTLLGGAVGYVIGNERAIALMGDLKLQDSITPAQCRILASIEVVEAIAIPILTIFLVALALR